jgi:hypothetical protein
MVRGAIKEQIDDSKDVMPGAFEGISQSGECWRNTKTDHLLFGQPIQHHNQLRSMEVSNQIQQFGDSIMQDNDP